MERHIQWFRTRFAGASLPGAKVAPCQILSSSSITRSCSTQRQLCAPRPLAESRLRRIPATDRLMRFSGRARPERRSGRPSLIGLRALSQTPQGLLSQDGEVTPLRHWRLVHFTEAFFRKRSEKCSNVGCQINRKHYAIARECNRPIDKRLRDRCLSISHDKLESPYAYVATRGISVRSRRFALLA